MKQALSVTDSHKFHFFGYYDKFQDNASGELLLSMETDFMERMPTEKDIAGICVVEVKTGKTERIAETSSWCWQQSCMLQWLPSSPENTIIFNTRLENQFGSCIMNINNGNKRFFDRPVYTVSPDGKFALSLNFSRLAECRPGYGYEGIPDLWRNVPSPEDDGIYYLDLETGKSFLIISLAELAGKGKSAEYLGSHHRFNHLQMAPDGKRFAFLHRWLIPGGGRMHQFYSSDIGGNNTYLLNDNMTSHFNWKNSSTLVAWADTGTSQGHYYLFDDKTENRRMLGEKRLVLDGHMSYNPIYPDWLVTDTYPFKEDNKRRLILYNEKKNSYTELGRFYADPKLNIDCRCDLHPRWSRDGKKIYFDSIHEKMRQIYMIDVEFLVSEK